MLRIGNCGRYPTNLEYILRYGIIFPTYNHCTVAHPIVIGSRVNAKFDDQLSLNRAVQNNLIDAQWFLPFTIYRLQQYTASSQLLLMVTLEQIHTTSTISRRLLLHWEENSPQLSLPPVQDTVITEWAACGIACAVLPFYTGLQLVKVTESGDRFDYWVGDGQQLYGLEISGILHGRLEPRQRMKARQLLDNPFGIGGYVCIVQFDQQRVNLSFHRR